MEQTIDRKMKIYRRPEAPRMTGDENVRFIDPTNRPFWSEWGNREDDDV